MGRTWGLVVAAVLLGVALLTNGIARAEASDNERELDGRLDFIQDRLERGTSSAVRWQYSWTAIHGGWTVAQFGFAAGMRNKDQEEDRHDYIVGGFTSALAAGDLIINPLIAYSAAEKLRAFPVRTKDEKKAKLQYAEQLLKECAAREEYGRSWKPHAAAALVNLLASVAIAAHGGRGGDGALSFATGMLVSEIQIYTMPTQAMDDWKEYQELSASGSFVRQGSSFKDQFFVTIYPHAAYCTIRF